MRATSYQGEHVAQVEVEACWQLWRRFSLVGFVGAGGTWIEFDRFESRTGVVAGGVGVRYQLARKHGLHVGFDDGFGPAEPIWYVVIGNAWFRP